MGYASNTNWFKDETASVCVLSTLLVCGSCIQAQIYRMRISSGHGCHVERLHQYFVVNIEHTLSSLYSWSKILCKAFFLFGFHIVRITALALLLICCVQTVGHVAMLCCYLSEADRLFWCTLPYGYELSHSFPLLPKLWSQLLMSGKHWYDDDDLQQSQYSCWKFLVDSQKVYKMCPIIIRFTVGWNVVPN